MRRIIVVLAVAALLMPQMSSGAAYGQAYVSFRYVVVFATDTVPGNAADVIRAAGGDLVTALPQVGVAIAESHDVRFQASLQRRPGVLAVGPERSRALPELAGFQAEELQPEGIQLAAAPVPTQADPLAEQWNLRRVHANEAWAAGATGSSNIVVAVIDNGIASNQPDIKPNLVFSGCFSSPNHACIPYPSIPTVGGAHGTMVAGIIAATFGNGPVVGVGPNLSLAGYNVFEPAGGGRFEALDSSVWAAMLDAAEQGFHVINLSLGDYVTFPEKEAATWAAWTRVVNAVVRLGVTIVASAGNDAEDLNGNVAHIPSDLPGVISVGGTGIRPQAAFPQTGAFDVPGIYGGLLATNTGAAVDLVAPGGDCGPNNACVSPNPYAIWSTAVVTNPNCAQTESCMPITFRGPVGTSFAAPHVAGVAGLILSRNPQLQPHQVAAILKRTASPILRAPDEPEPGRARQKFGHGMVDALEAVNAAHAP